MKLAAGICWGLAILAALFVGVDWGVFMLVMGIFFAVLHIADAVDGAHKAPDALPFRAGDKPRPMPQKEPGE